MTLLTHATALFSRNTSPSRVPIRVVRIIDRLNVGGPAKHVVWLTSGLNAVGFETVLVTGTVAAGEEDMGYFAQMAGVVPHVIRGMSRELSWRDLLVVIRLACLLRHLQPHIVHTHKAKAGAVGRAAVLLYRWSTLSALWLRPRACQVVHTYHGHVLHSYFGPLKTRLFLAIERFLAKVGTDRIVTVSEQQRRELAEQFQVGRPQQFRVIPLGLDLHEPAACRGRLRRELGVSEEALLVGMVGRLCEVKHHVMLLQAASQLLQKYSATEIRFVIIGDGHLRPELELLTSRLGLTNRVVFIGFRKDVLSLYVDLDVIALTSLNEGTPLTLIEAMCCGRAVATTEVGGVVDILGQRRAVLDGFSVWDHGVSAPSRDATGFAQALRYLLEHPTLRHRMGEHGRAFVRDHLSRERLVRDIEDLYCELMREYAENCSRRPS